MMQKLNKVICSVGLIVLPFSSAADTCSKLVSDFLTQQQRIAVLSNQTDKIVLLAICQSTSKKGFSVMTTRYYDPTEKRSNAPLSGFSNLSLFTVQKKKSKKPNYRSWESINGQLVTQDLSKAQFQLRIRVRESKDKYIDIIEDIKLTDNQITMINSDDIVMGIAKMPTMF